MIKFIKYSSLIMILLFFPTSFYYNTILLNLKSNNHSQNLFIKNSSIEINAFGNVEWNGKEWIAIITVFSNTAIKEIDWGNPIETEKGFMVNIIIKLIEGSLKEEIKEHNYSLGILPEGSYWFDIYINGNFKSSVLFEVSKIITTCIYIVKTITSISTITVIQYFPKRTETEFITRIYEVERVETSYITIPVKEKTQTKIISTKTTQITEAETIETFQTFTEEETIEYTTSIIEETENKETYAASFIFLILVIAISLYIILKRKKHV
ncbi:MAG: hypothetical protein QXY18_05190 [Nitrososphaerota archaeon]